MEQEAAIAYMVPIFNEYIKKKLCSAQQVKSSQVKASKR